jgi:hypothetical protein
MPDEKRSSVNIDLAASARAEIKTEIPAASSGRLVDALTDMIRPFTEKRGLRADQIRLQREDVLIEIARKAKARIGLEGQEIKPIPNKFLVPFLEKASLEELDSEMVDRWVGLLVSQSLHASPNHLYFLDRLSQLSGEHCRLFDEIMGHCDDNEALEATYDIHLEYGQGIGVNIEALGRKRSAKAIKGYIVEYFCNTIGISLVYCGAEHSALEHKPYYMIDDDLEKVYSDDQEPLFMVLENHGFLARAQAAHQRVGRWTIGLEFFYVTTLGVQFYQSCKGFPVGPVSIFGYESDGD